MVTPLHPVPPCENVGGHEQCPRDYRTKDPLLERATEGSVLGGLIRFIGHYNPNTRNWSRTRSSYQMFKGLELGWAHMAISNAAQILHDITVKLPDVARWAWGEGADNFTTEKGAEKYVAQFRGRYIHPSELEYLSSGWYQISARPDVNRVYLERWYNDFVVPVCDWMRNAGMVNLRTFAAGVRMRNSSTTMFSKLQSLCKQFGEEDGRERALEQYGHADRTEIINTWPVFQGRFTECPTLDEIDFGDKAEWPTLKWDGTTSHSKGGDTGGLVGQTTVTGASTASAPPISYGYGGQQIAVPMSKTTKYLLIGGGIALVVGGVAYYVVTRKPKKRKKR